MRGNVIVRGKNGGRDFFYYSDGGIYHKELTDDGCFDRGRLAADVRKAFSVNPAQNGEAFIICQGETGDIYIISKNNGKWERKTIIRANGSQVKDIVFYSTLGSRAMELIYLIDYGNKKGQIMLCSIGKNGAAGGGQLIDECLSLYDGCFSIQRTGQSRYIILYMKRTEENQLGYAEINQNVSSGFIAVYKTGQRITDSSFLAENNRIHFLYIVKSIFSSRVIYIRKDERGISSPVVLYEGQAAGVCALFSARGALYCAWTANRQIYYTLSHNGGESFEPLQRSRNYNGAGIVKADYLSLGGADDNNFMANDIFTDLSGMPVFMTDFCLKNDTASVDLKGGQRTDANMSDRVEAPSAQVNGSEYTIAFEKLKNSLELAQMQLKEKDTQILRLNEALQRRSSEGIKAERRLTAKIAELRREIKELKEKRDNESMVKSSASKDNMPEKTQEGQED